MEAPARSWIPREVSCAPNSGETASPPLPLSAAARTRPYVPSVRAGPRDDPLRAVPLLNIVSRSARFHRRVDNFGKITIDCADDFHRPRAAQVHVPDRSRFIRLRGRGLRG
jgi:hypothetical protein